MTKKEYATLLKANGWEEHLLHEEPELADRIMDGYSKLCKQFPTAFIRHPKNKNLAYIYALDSGDDQLSYQEALKEIKDFVTKG